MKIKGENIKEEQMLQRGHLYHLFNSRTLVFEENNTADVVNINYILQKGQYGIYGNEYKSHFAGSESQKKADILVLIVDEHNKKFTSWIVDVKESVGGEDVIFHLIEQLLTSIKHKNALKAYLDDFVENENVGYISREYEKERVLETIKKKKEYISSENHNIKILPALIQSTMERKLLDEKAKLKVLMDFSEDSICDGSKKYKLKYYKSELRGDKYVCDLVVKL